MPREVAPNTLACGESDSITLKPATHGPRLFRTAPFPMTSKYKSLNREQMTTSRIAVWLSRTANEVRRWTFRPMLPCLAPALWMMFIPGLASAQSAEAQGSTPGAIQGTVKDGSGSAVMGAIVTLEAAASTGQRTAITDQAGSLRFPAVEPGNYKITIAAPGFAIWTTPNVAVAPGDHPPLLSSVLQLAVASSSVNVTLPPHELAAEQLKSEEKQRLLGVLPDFFVSYAPNAAPLTAAQKFQLGWKTIIDPVSLLGTSISAGIQQARNNYPEFGQGTEGYAKRFGAQYANRVSRVIIGRVVMQSIFHPGSFRFPAVEPGNYKITIAAPGFAIWTTPNVAVAPGDHPPLLSSVLQLDS